MQMNTSKAITWVSISVAACLALLMIVLGVHLKEDLRPLKEAFFRKISGPQEVTFSGMKINVPDSWFIDSKDSVKLSFVTMPDMHLHSPGLVTFRKEAMTVEQLMADTARKTIMNRKVEFSSYLNIQILDKTFTGIAFDVFESERNVGSATPKNTFAVWTIPERNVVIRASGIAESHKSLLEQLLKSIVFSE